MRIALIMIAFASVASAGCIPVSSSRITAGDLVGPIPLFHAIDPTTPLGFAPAPGLQRTLSVRELVIFGRANGLAMDAAMTLPSICVEREAHAVSLEDLKAALLASLGVADASLELLDYSRQPVANGQLEFPLAGLNRPPVDAPEAPVIWRGRLTYDGQRSVTLWARVRITVPGSYLVAAAPIAAGSVIRPEQVKELSRQPYPFPGVAAAAMRNVAGQLARCNISPGQAVLVSALAPVRDVNKGDRVQVIVVDGLASLSFSAVARSDGNVGEAVSVQNPASGRDFRAVVESRGTVRVRTARGESQ